jgi:hypothetical protein
MTDPPTLLDRAPDQAFHGMNQSLRAAELVSVFGAVLSWEWWTTGRVLLGLEVVRGDAGVRGRGVRASAGVPGDRPG